MEYLLGSFAGIVAVMILASSLTIYQKQIAIKDKIAFVWLIITGSIHLFVEGYFGYYHETLQSDNFLIAQWWKEYSLSDSRYLSSDPFVLNMERITAVSNKSQYICIYNSIILTLLSFLSWHIRSVGDQEHICQL